MWETCVLATTMSVDWNDSISSLYNRRDCQVTLLHATHLQKLDGLFLSTLIQQITKTLDGTLGQKVAKIHARDVEFPG